MATSVLQILTFDFVTNTKSPLERFDRREMLIVHDVLRREFALMRGLVATVALGDRPRAKVVGDHIDVLTSLLHHHHAGEESHVWPLLIDRCADSVAALTVSMHDQHEELAAHLDAVNAALGFWRADATADARSRLDDALHQLLTSLRKHLDDEERDVVPLMEQHITATEWDQMVQEGSADADPADLPLLFGMLMYEADPAITARVLAVMPDEARPVIAAEAGQAFAEHSRALHGTPTPPRSTELTGSRHV